MFTFDQKASLRYKYQRLTPACGPQMAKRRARAEVRTRSSIRASVFNSMRLFGLAAATSEIEECDDRALLPVEKRASVKEKKVEVPNPGTVEEYTRSAFYAEIIYQY